MIKMYAGHIDGYYHSCGETIQDALDGFLLLNPKIVNYKWI